MKTNKFVQFFDKDERPILSLSGMVKYPKRYIEPNDILKSLKRSKKVPHGAVYYAIHQTQLQSIIKLTQKYPVNDNQTNVTT